MRVGCTAMRGCLAAPGVPGRACVSAHPAPPHACQYTITGFTVRPVCMSSIALSMSSRA